MTQAQEKPPAPAGGYPAGVEEIRYPVPADRSEQPALFWKPEKSGKGGEKVPLLVALHTWSSDYRQAGGEALYARWCQDRGWVFIHPNFRGPNRAPEALGSDLAIADIRAAVEFAKSVAAVDESRIYAVGVSGGGHITQLLAGRAPEIWAGISSWCGISDIAAWHADTTAAGRAKYARDIERALGGPPDSSPARAEDARHRSPLTWLENAAGVPLDLAAGLDDGRSGSVPFTHSLRAWNAVAPADARLSEEAIAAFYETRQPPPGVGSPVEDALYGKRPPVFRLVRDNTRVTIFRGGHEIVHEAALNWLAAQRKGQPANWNPPKIGALEATDADTQSGK
ncbi:MAG: prolyl oligopeptidase family serine peptidase [Verrucomicrobiae bacterium]|nr:prolyl oligopeptidase family serine peptidase [Verrucomicrobiae bacterium]MCP5540615.1 prolyl oligopeptidase family serine peptidase [Akkermansiaceae bacterium]